MVSDGQRSPTSVPHTSTFVLLALLLAAFVVGGAGTYAVLRYRAPRAHAALPVSSVRVTSAVVVETSVPVEALPAPKTTTLLVFTPSRFGHRVWIDGAMVGEDTKPIETKCGRHTIKIGSQGKPRDVDLPCGGETKL